MSRVELRLELLRLAFTHAYSIEECLGRIRELEKYVLEGEDNEPKIAKAIARAKKDKEQAA